MYKLEKFLIVLGLSLMLVLAAQADVSTPNVTVSPNQANNFAQYTISSNTGNQSLRSGQDSIIIVFNASTNVPNNITPSLITVNNTAVNSVMITGQRVAVLTPVNVVSGGPFSVVIDVSAKVKNPGTAGDYTLQVATSRGSDKTLVTSNQYTIAASSSTVSPASVTPNPSVEGNSASYTIGFDVGSGGFLEANTGTMTIAFPVETTIPNGSLSGVTVNGTPATATAGSDTVIVTTPIDIENDGSVELFFAIGSGVVNPAQDSTNYKVSIRTSSETTFILSDPYIISPAGALSISAITSKPDTVNQSGEFAFDFRTGSSGALIANTDTITVIFEQNTYIPSDIAPSNILVSSGGFSDNAAAVIVSNGDLADEDTVHVVTPINVSNSSDVTLTFSASSGYQNPSIAGNYEIKLRTSKDTGVVTSNPFSVFNTATKVSQAIVIPANSSTGVTTSYTVNFDLGTLGRLAPGESTITLSFDNNYTLSTDTNNYDLSKIVIGGSDTTALAGSNITPNNGTKIIQITLPNSVVTSNGSSILLILDDSTTDPITNPNAQGNYVLGVKTSVEATNVNSATYNIGGDALTFWGITLGDSTVNNISSYTFDVELVNSIRNNQNDYMTIIFPAGTVLPASINGADVTMDGRASASVNVNQATRTITAYVGTGPALSGRMDVLVTANAGIENPAVPNGSFYNVTMSTSKDQSPVNSAFYNVTGGVSQVTSVSATANPAVISATNVAYTVNFTTSSSGKIKGGAAAGSSTITVDFDSITIVPASINASSVEINSTPSGGVSVLDSGNGIILITLPNGQTIDSTTAVQVSFASSAGLSNSTTPGIYNVRVRTSSDTTYADTTGTAGDYPLGAAQNLSVTSVTPNPSTQNSAAGYSIKFTTGSSGALSAGDSIRIVFPSNTSLPASVNLNDVTVDGLNPPSDPRISGDTIIVAAPDTITPLADVTVLLNQSANILNPTLVQSYTLEVGTDTEPGLFTSPTYNITSTTSTLSVANVTVQPPTPSAGATYIIDFSVGDNGRLIGGSGSITVTFNGNTTVDADTANYDSTYIFVDGTLTQIPTTSLSISGQAITLTIPTGVSVDNGDDIILTIGRVGTPKPLTNPASPDSYTLQIRSNVETSDITSNAYTISSVTPVTNVTMSLSSNIVNDASSNTISFRVQNALTAGSGTVTITFPFNTFIPSSISTSQVRVANDLTNPVTFKNANSVVVNTSIRTVTVTVDSNITAGDSVRVAFLTTAGLENPSIFGNYTVNVKTSNQPLDRTSATYNLIATTTTILNLSVDIVPITPSEFGEFTYTFNTGSRGRLISGTSTISLMFPEDVTFTTGVPANSKVTVNSTAADALDLRLGGSNPDTLEVTVPSSVTIGNSSAVTVIVDVTAGVRNASSTTSLSYQAFTSVETSSDTSDFSLPVELTLFETKSENGHVLLTWVTESEVDNAFWMIEKKELSKSEFKNVANGKLNIGDTQMPFAKAAQLYGQGTTASRTEYTYVDSLVTVGNVYAYRLIDVSYSGLITYHEVVYQEVKVPVYFSLKQNYPNPFNPSTQIAFSLPRIAQIEIKIFNILGQEVKTLLSDVREAGFHSIRWDGRNQFDDRVASGIYIYLMQALSLDGQQKYNKVRKMVLLK
jgi:hypothetical protein